MKLSNQQITILQEYFKRKPVKSLYLFGSYARGDADTESDIDLLIKMDFDSIEQLKIEVVKKELNNLLSIKLDIYFEHRISKYAKESIWLERQLLLSKQ